MGSVKSFYVSGPEGHLMFVNVFPYYIFFKIGESFLTSKAMNIL